MKKTTFFIPSNPTLKIKILSSPLFLEIWLEVQSAERWGMHTKDKVVFNGTGKFSGNRQSIIFSKVTNLQMSTLLNVNYVADVAFVFFQNFQKSFI